MTINNYEKYITKLNEYEKIISSENLHEFTELTNAIVDSLSGNYKIRFKRIKFFTIDDENNINEDDLPF